MRFYYFLSIYFFFIVSFYSETFAQKNAYASKGVASYYHGWLDGKKTANGEKYDESKMTAAHLTLPFNSKVRVTNLSNQKSIIVRINDRGPYIDKRIIDLSRAAADSLDFIFNGLAKVELKILSYGKPKDNQNQQLIASAKIIKKSAKEAVKEPIVTKSNVKIILPIETSKIVATKEIVISEKKTIESKEIADNSVYGLQIGSFKVKSNASKLSDKIKLNYKEEINIEEIKKGNISFFRLIIGKFADEKEAVKLKEKLNKDYPESFIIRH